VSLGLECQTVAPECEVSTVTVCKFVNLQFVIHVKQCCI